MNRYSFNSDYIKPAYGSMVLIASGQRWRGIKCNAAPMLIQIEGFNPITSKWIATELHNAPSAIFEIDRDRLVEVYGLDEWRGV